MLTKSGRGMMVKYFLVVLATAALSQCTARARLFETPEQCAGRYGPHVAESQRGKGILFERTYEKSGFTITSGFVSNQTGKVVAGYMLYQRVNPNPTYKTSQAEAPRLGSMTMTESLPSKYLWPEKEERKGLLLTVPGTWVGDDTEPAKPKKGAAPSILGNRKAAVDLEVKKKKMLDALHEQTATVVKTLWPDSVAPGLVWDSSVSSAANAERGATAYGFEFFGYVLMSKQCMDKVEAAVKEAAQRKEQKESRVPGGL